jgi:predicted nucleic acid-binding protein
VNAEVFADAGYWIALLNPRNNLHAKARDVSLSLGEFRIVTSEMVLTEVLNAFASRGELLRRAVCSLIESIRRDMTSEIVAMSDTGFDEGLELYEQRAGKTWGMTDCTSFVIMKRHKIKVALSGDRDFRQAGFKALLIE